MTDQNGGEATRLWPFAPLYEQVLKEGHQKQAPASGSPTLIWHMALWPNQPFGERGGEREKITRARAVELFEEYDEDNLAFFKELNEFALALQARGRVGDAQPLKWRAAEIHVREGAREVPHRFLVCDPQSLAFTLWWQDSAKGGVPNIRQDTPAPTDLRVRVQIQTHRDHATVAFYIDVAKLHGVAQLGTAEEVYRVGGERRPKILHGLDRVRAVSANQIRGGFVEMNRIPEQGVSEDDAKALLASADYCYDGVWKEFAQAFGLEGILDRRSKGYTHSRLSDRFADFRGLIMSVRGIDTPEKLQRKAARDDLRAKNATQLDPQVKAYLDREDARDGYTPSPTTGTIGFGQVSQFESESNEGNTVLKSLWPFMRRITPWADYSDWVGCGIINGRALYVTALGSEALVGAANEESAGRSSDVPNNHLPEAEKKPPPKEGETPEPRSLRYLIVTKGEPLREQLGRFVERINAIGTMRLFALRHMPDIRNASVHIEVLGRMLDGTLRHWEQRRLEIDEWYSGERERLDEKQGRKKRNRTALSEADRIAHDAERRVDNDSLDLEHQLSEQLTVLIRETEREVIAVASMLDNMGAGGYGRLLYAIRRASYFSNEFERMWQTLGIEDIPGWINYRNFVQRGMQPAFTFIKATGERLISIRDRLQTITETIQTAALIVETGATRENTARLKQMASVFLFARRASLALIAIWVYQLTLHDWVKPKVESYLHPQLDRMWEAAFGPAPDANAPPSPPQQAEQPPAPSSADGDAATTSQTPRD